MHKVWQDISPEVEPEDAPQNSLSSETFQVCQLNFTQFAHLTKHQVVHT